ncbi:MAG TPA: diguanylate phosphodiesterase [Clostridiales bacterium]|nr:diguanylate phosphodiesterase [Clostridiales bacterium]
MYWGIYMDIFVARQPIFDTKKNVFAYELLYRDSSVNKYTETDGNKATAAVLANSFMEIGYDTITNGKKAFINFTEELLHMGAPTLFPKELIVIEILEDVEPTAVLVGKCIEFKEKGYTIALDDFEYRYISKYKSLLKVIDILKVDWLLNSVGEQINIVKEIKKINPKIKFLAEKIETNTDYEEALKSGYSLFQGYFFSKPTIIKGIAGQSSKLNYLQIINEIAKSNPDFDNITHVIERDPVLALQLLKLINSVTYRSIQRVTSVHEALVRLGMKEINKWVSVLMLRETTKEKPIEVMRTSLVRAYFMEGLVSTTILKNRKSEAFLFGLFSLVDVLFNYSKEELLCDIPLNDDVKSALLGKENEFSKIFKIITCYEKAEWDELEEHMKEKNITINPFQISEFYYNALKLAENLIEY